MAKKGTLFEQVVADIVRSFDSTLKVKQGSWITGPDGRRDRDVSFTGAVNGSPVKVLIECKDYNRQSTGAVGIRVVDEFDSKRRDLGIDLPVICSNAGFTKLAIKKAQRVGISIVGAARTGDPRIRFEIRDAIYFRRLVIPVQEFQWGLHFAGKAPDFARTRYDLSNITYDGRLVQDWAIARISNAVCVNPVVNLRLIFDATFLAPLAFNLSGTSFSVTGVWARAHITGAWYRQYSRIDASSGFYDWVRKRVRVGQSPQGSFSREFDYTAGQRVERPPDYILQPSSFLPGEADMALLQVYGPVISGPVPAIDEHVIPADRIVIIPNLEPTAYRSTPGFVPLP